MNLFSTPNSCECSFTTLSQRKPTSEKYLLVGEYWDQSHKNLSKWAGAKLRPQRAGSHSQFRWNFFAMVKSITLYCNLIFFLWNRACNCLPDRNCANGPETLKCYSDERCGGFQGRYNSAFCTRKWFFFFFFAYSEGRNFISKLQHLWVCSPVL